MKRTGLLLLALGTVLLRLAAAPREIAPGLDYLPVPSLDRDLPAVAAALAAPRALVLDCRATTVDRAPATGLSSALARAPGAPPVFVLVGPDTAPPLAAALAAAPASTGWITLGVPATRPAPHLAVAQSVAADRQAVAALAAGRAPASLVSGRLEKERFDEAALMAEFRGETPATPPPAGPPEKAAPPPLTDRVLQRALHLYQALAALPSRS